MKAVLQGINLKLFSPVDIKNSKWIDEREICGNCIKLFRRNWAIFIYVVNPENSLKQNNI